MTPGGQRAVAMILLAARIWQAAAPRLHARCSLPRNPPAPLNGTAARIRGTRH
jgi:hypothetical protein